MVAGRIAGKNVVPIHFPYHLVDGSLQFISTVGDRKEHNKEYHGHAKK